MSTTNDPTAGDAGLIDDFQKFYRKYYHEDIGDLALHYPNEQRSLVVDWRDLYNYDPELADDYLDNPEQLREYAEEALRLYDLPVDVDLGRAHVRVVLPDDKTYNVGAYRSDQIGDYLAVDAQVTKVTQVKPWPVEAAFECQRCGTVTNVPQSQNDIQQPHQCDGCEREGPFHLKEGQSEWVDTQLVKVEQPPEQTLSGQGASTEVRLEDDLVTDPNDPSFNPGDRLTLSGIYNVELDTDNGDVDQYIEGSAIEVEDNDFKDLDISPEEREKIEEIANGEHGDPYEMGVNSIAPKIQGRETIKLGLLLQMFRGVRVEYPDGSVDRGDIHILALGDPGTGKSELLKAVEEIAPRSVYASAKGASAAGMTAAVVPDDFGDTKWSVEAGALVLANNGVACVDEIDKVDDDAVSSMHEALEGQKVHINKAGINTTLPAQTSMLAAGNPKYGRFDQYEEIADQIDLGPTLLSRFDLLFTVQDTPTEEQDREVIDSMIDGRQTAIQYNRSGSDVNADDLEDIQPEIDPDLLRKYIAHARQNFRPTIEDEAVASKLASFFLSLRLKGDSEDSPVPVTFRKLEGMLRLAEASARVRLSNTIAMEDIERAKELVMTSMSQVGIDPETGEFDADIIEAGASKTTQDLKKALKSEITDLAKEYDTGAPVDAVVENMVEDHGFKKSKVEHRIEKMKGKGDIYEPQKDGHMRLTENQF